MGPNTAFCLVIFGALGIYCEFIWPGRIWQGILGVAAVDAGGYFLWRAAPAATGLELLTLAAVLFLLDTIVNTRFSAGVLATCALAAGFVLLIPGARGIRPLLAIPWCVVFGATTMALNWAGRRARSNKWSDLADAND
jgi:membrane-bound ClpP family serine protease